MHHHSAAFRRCILVSLTLALSAVAAVPASAGVGRFSTGVTISKSAPAFHGRVFSDASACSQQRRVNLFKKRAGDDRKLGSDRTDNQRRWEVLVDPLRSGAYYAKAPRRERMIDGQAIICGKDRSRTIVVD